MKKYLVKVPIHSGYRVFLVEADSPEYAVDNYFDGEIVKEEIEDYYEISILTEEDSPRLYRRLIGRG